MSQESEIVAFLLGEEELGQIISGWPDALRLAVCLDPDGGCLMLVHHRDEDDRILARVSEAIQEPVGSFCVVPERPGCPTRRMLFSEEQRLLALVSDMDGLLETAHDYAINYAFAAEEGLDPELLTTGAASQSVQGRPQRPDVRTAVEEPPRPATPERPVTAPEANISLPAAIDLEAPPAEIQQSGASRLPEGFRSLDSDELHHGLFATGLLSLGRSGRVILTVGRPSEDEAPAEVHQIYFRDDLLSFALPLSDFEGLENIPQRIAFDPGLFPSGLIGALEQASQGVRVTASGAYLYTTLAPARIPVLAAPRREQVPPVVAALSAPRRPGRALKAGVGGGAIALVALLMLHIGLGPAGSAATSLQKPDPNLRAEIFRSVPLKP